MTKTTEGRLAWEGEFLAALGEGQSVSAAAKAAGISYSTTYWHRKRSRRFTREWQAALGPKRRKALPENTDSRSAHWRKDFLEALAESSNVSASAAKVKVDPRTVYKLRREDGEFAARWLAALHEGYDNLEMELLGYLRAPKPERKMDVAASLRLLAAHRDTVERRRSLTEDEDEQQVLDSIDRFIDEMRERRAANEAVLAETEAGEEETNDGAQ
jgi:transposase